MRKFARINQYRIQSQRGIGLLELMLAMVIISIMTLMSIQYFSSSKRNTTVTQAVDELQDIIGIVGGMPAPASSTDLTSDVALSGQLPGEYAYADGSIGTPWSQGSTSTSNFTLSVASGILTIEGIGIPNWGCQSISNKYTGTGAGVTCGTDKSSTDKSFKMTVPLSQNGDL